MQNIFFKQHKSSSVFIIILFLMYGCSNTESAKNSSLQQKIINEKRILSISDSAYNLIEANAEEDVYNLYFEGLEKLNSDIPDSLQFKYYSTFAYLFHNKAFPNEAIKNIRLAIKYGKKMKRYDDVYRYSSLMAINYGYLKKYDSMEIVYKQAISYGKTKPANIYYLALQNNLGIFYYEIKKNNALAMEQFNNLYNYPLSFTALIELDLKWSMRDNIALIYMDEKKYKQAQDFFKFNYKDYGNYYKSESFLTEKWLRAGLQLAEAYIFTNNMKGANTILSEIEYNLNILGNYSEKRILSDLLYLKVKAEFYNAKKQYKKANELLKKRAALVEKETAAKIEIERQRQYVFRELGVKQMQKRLVFEETAKLKEQEQVTKLRILIAIGLIAAGLIIFLLRDRARKKQTANLIKQKLVDENIEKERLEKKLLEQTIYYKKKDITDLAVHITQSQEWIGNLLRRIQQLKKVKGKKKEKEIDSLVFEIKHKLKIENQTPTLQRKVDILSSEFYNNLKEVFPKLTKTDLRLCSFIRMNMENNEIAALQNVNLESIHVGRSRLKKRLGLSKNDDLNHFLLNFNKR